ncbi:MAG: PorP/SprF family type IX secretion system membrane protein [Lutibacter sp.]
MKKILILFIIIVCYKINYAQQDAQYTQYMYNMNVINPAYTTDNIGIVNIGALHRTQWVGVNGSPKSSNLFIHAPIDNKFEVGLSLVNDNIGNVVKENNLYADVAYKIDLEDKGMISFGIKTGFSFFDVDFNNFSLESGAIFTDPNFADNIHKSYFNMGAGVFYNTVNYYIGFSIPTLFNTKYLDRSNGKYQGTKQSHLFLTGGYVYQLNDLIKLKPAFMAKIVKGANPVFDITANVLYNNRLELGVAYRIDDAFSGMINFKATPELRIGYAYDHTLSNLGPFSSGSHELFILYDFDLFNLQKGFDKSPRFF